jgi:hypothetical protein
LEFFILLFQVSEPVVLNLELAGEVRVLFPQSLNLGELAGKFLIFGLMLRVHDYLLIYGLLHPLNLVPECYHLGLVFRLKEIVFIL